jgi:hypothetical protein
MRSLLRVSWVRGIRDKRSHGKTALCVDTEWLDAFSDNFAEFILQPVAIEL